MNKVTIYSTPFCHFCKMAKEYFKSKSIAYDEFDVFKDVAKREEMVRKSGQLGVPVIDIDGNIIVGFDLPRINQYLNIK